MCEKRLRGQSDPSAGSPGSRRSHALLRSSHLPSHHVSEPWRRQRTAARTTALAALDGRVGHHHTRGNRNCSSFDFVQIGCSGGTHAADTVRHSPRNKPDRIDARVCHTVLGTSIALAPDPEIFHLKTPPVTFLRVQRVPGEGSAAGLRPSSHDGNRVREEGHLYREQPAAMGVS